MVKPTPERGRFRELVWMSRVGISHIVEDGGGTGSRRDVCSLGASRSGRQIGHLGSSDPQRAEFRYLRTAIVGHQGSNSNEFC